jgi:hypothetical protein
MSALGCWLNRSTQPATVHDPVNVVRRGRSEIFFLLDDQGPPLIHRGGVLGKIWFEIGTQWGSTLTL